MNLSFLYLRHFFWGVLQWWREMLTSFLCESLFLRLNFTERERRTSPTLGLGGRKILLRGVPSKTLVDDRIWLTWRLNQLISTSDGSNYSWATKPVVSTFSNIRFFQLIHLVMYLKLLCLITLIFLFFYKRKRKELGSVLNIPYVR